MNQFNFIDICAGVGGFRTVFDSLKGNCVMTCEIDKFCKKTYLDNFKESSWENDVTQINPSSISDFDILCAGFPCQAFSIGGHQQGFSDTKGRGTIFFNLVDIIKEKRPSILFFENVKHLLNHDKKRTFKVIQDELTKLGYHHHYFIINSKFFVPQRRERIYIIGLDKEKYNEEQFQNIIKNIDNDYLEQQKQTPSINDILEINVSSKYTLSDKLWNFLQSHSLKHSNKGNGFGYGLIDPAIDLNTRTLTARYYKDGSEILIKQINKNPRKLTPRETARLMGFPETFKQTSSDTQSYKQMGNSVVVPVIHLIAKHLVALHNEKKGY